MKPPALVTAEEARRLMDNEAAAHAAFTASRSRKNRDAWGNAIEAARAATPALCATVVALSAERDEARIAAADLIEIIGETAWGVQLPVLFVYGPVTLPDGTVGASPTPTVLAPESAKQLVEHLYRRVSAGRGWLREERALRAAAEAERDRLADILACERGEKAPEGWTWHRAGEFAFWKRGDWVASSEPGSGKWGYGNINAGTEPADFHTYALEALEAADTAAKGAK